MGGQWYWYCLDDLPLVLLVLVLPSDGGVEADMNSRLVVVVLDDSARTDSDSLEMVEYKLVKELLLEGQRLGILSDDDDRCS